MKTISKILSIVLCLTLVLGMAIMVSAAETVTSADLNTLNGGEIKSTYAEYTTASGWTLKNGQVVGAATNSNGSDFSPLGTNLAAVMNGKTSAVGSLTSPTLTGGIKALSFNYANFYSENNGVDITITIAYGDKTVTHKLDKEKAVVAKNTAYTETWTLDATIEGDFTITFSNNSPTNSTSNKDRVAIWNVTWTPAAAAVHTHTWSTTPSKVASKNDTHHTYTYPCTDPTCTATNPVDEAHTLVNNECACGYKYVAPTVVDIKDATTKGTSYTVKGVVTLLDGQNIYVQDATGGICVRVSAKPTDLKVGDTIIGTGKRDTYNGLPQLGSATYEKSTGMTLSAKETTIDKLTTADIGTYIKLVNVEVTEVFDNNGAYTTPNITVKDAAGNKIQIYKAVVGKTGDAWNVKIGDKLTVTAAVGVYNTTLQLRNTVATEIVPYSAPAQTGDTTLSIAVALMAVSAMGIAVVASKKKEF